MARTTTTGIALELAGIAVHHPLILLLRHLAQTEVERLSNLHAMLGHFGTETTWAGWSLSSLRGAWPLWEAPSSGGVPVTTSAEGTASVAFESGPA